MTSQGGRIITFYSYKGGTGRSMAVANLAWVLATNGKRVLLIDWDMEAPGLHRYFRPFLIDPYLTSSEGLIDFVMAYADQVIKPSEKDVSKEWFIPCADITRYAIAIDAPEFPGSGKIDFVPAGRQGPTYATRVSSFDWYNFYDRLGGGAFFEAVKQHVREEYEYILIDSRTGVSDTSGICTVQMPDALAVCFTYNNQSIEGAAAIARSARDARRNLAVTNTASPSYEIFPIPTRVEQAEQQKLRSRQRYARSVFDDLLASEVNRDAYWEAVEIPYVPYYGYEETLAPFADKPNDPKSILGAIVRIGKYLTDKDTDGGVIDFKLPLSEEENRRIRLEFAATPTSDGEGELEPSVSTESSVQEKVRQAESFFLHLIPELQEQARRVLTRLVRVARLEDGGEISRQRVKLAEVENWKGIVSALTAARLIAVTSDTASKEEVVELTDEVLVRQWSRLRDWIERDRDFLLWRQKLRDQLIDWESSDFRSGFLLRSEQLREAVTWLGTHRSDLNKAEREFIARSSETEYKTATPTTRAGGRVFIIRPFGQKNEVDFDEVARDLISPALNAIGVGGGETLDIVESRSIRTDMFQRLLTADLIVADVSIPHANVFYELGIRHALRERSTLLITCQPNRMAFDLHSDRNFVYSADSPAASLPALVDALRQKLESNVSDSPVFLSLPNLREPEFSNLVTLPADFREEVNYAKDQRRVGDLALLSHEVKGFEWEMRGWRAVGTAQFEIGHMMGARATWEKILTLDPSDLEANVKLGTVYQRLGDLARSTEALERAWANKNITKFERAEVSALLARNAKTRWQETWNTSTSLEERRAQALRSAYLQESIDSYRDAYDEDLNHYYSGLNALALLRIRIELAEALPDVWSQTFDSDEDADRELRGSRQLADKLAISVEQSLQATVQHLARDGSKDIWADISAADLRLLTSNRPVRVASSYRDALAGAPAFAVDSVRRQLGMYRDLGVFSENVEEVMKGVGEPVATPASDVQTGRVLLFVGHMIDAPDRSSPRFPASKEEAARTLLRDAVLSEISAGANVVGAYSGGASGGDILFQEVCAELNVPSNLYLALPPDMYVKSSVAAAGPAWVERFWKLRNQHELRGTIRVLSSANEAEALPAWLRSKRDYGIWQRNNLWLLFNALAEGGDKTTLITLWNGEKDGVGSIGYLTEKAMAEGARTINIHTSSL